MWGAAIGDAMGSAFEFVGAKAIAKHLGEPIVRRFEPAMRGSLLYPREPGMPTDDTAMALSVALAIAGGDELDARVFAIRFLSDLDRDAGILGDVFWSGGPGSATVRALSRLRAGAEPATCGDENDGGNGAAMRAHPVGFLRDRDEVLRIAAIQARVTHGHPAAVASAQAVAVLCHDAIDDAPASSSLPAGIDEPTFAAAWARAHRNDEKGGDLPLHLCDVLMSGWETVAGAHAISLRYDDPLEAIGRAAASGQDTDTIASIVGAIVGARSGYAAIAQSSLVRDAIDTNAPVFATLLSSIAALEAKFA